MLKGDGEKKKWYSATTALPRFWHGNSAWIISTFNQVHVVGFH
jgi:hypothetical protein